MSKENVYTIDKSDWPDGPWMVEPDKVQWVTAAGLPALIVRPWHGSWCGYVGVPNGHPYFEKGYDDVPVEVHGGLTYADHCQADGPICHVPRPGESDDVWWLGFDCAHAFDLSPGMLTFRSGLHNAYPDEVYRDMAYVRAEVEDLARQLADATR